MPIAPIIIGGSGVRPARPQAGALLANLTVGEAVYSITSRASCPLFFHLSFIPCVSSLSAPDKTPKLPIFLVASLL